MKYNVMVIDPPWQQQKGGKRKVRHRQAKQFNYGTMDTESIFGLLDMVIFPLATSDHAVFMWTIEKFLIPCEAAMSQRGYKRHCRFIWNKCNGIAPAFTVRFCHEYLIWFYKARLPPIAKDVRGLFRTVFSEKPRQHSRKPDSSYNMIEALYPFAKRIDVFSRESRDGWQQFGDETNYYNSKI